MRNTLFLHEKKENLCISAKDAELVRNLLEAGEHSFAYEKIRKLMYEFPDSPAPHNLMGVYCEFERDLTSAVRHYRASLALHPGYSSAENNLKRVTSYEPSCSWQIDYGHGKYASNKSAKLHIGDDEQSNGSILFSNRT